MRINNNKNHSSMNLYKFIKLIDNEKNRDDSAHA